MANQFDGRALAMPVDEPISRSSSTSPAWNRPTFRTSGSHRRSSSFASVQQPFAQRVLRKADRLQRRAWKEYNKLSALQRAGAIIAGLATVVVGILFLIYNERIFSWLAPIAAKWRDIPGGWLILWSATFIVSFPPLIGYSSCVTLAGFVYGFPNGWYIVASATILGSTASFLLSRYLIHDFVHRLIQRDARFAALALTLKHDGIKLLVMIRLCPLPYSLSNGALSTIPTVGWPAFMAATAAVSPKLLLHVFIGSQLAKIAESGDKMDAKTKAMSYISIVVGVLAGAATGWFIYRQTKKRARELEQVEAERLRVESEEEIRAEYADDPESYEAAETLREHVDDISLRDAWDDEYRDDDEEVDDDAQVRDVFDEGDGDDVK
ncbi:hypothetical protein EJ06DRAFT_494372 [Trichodelitschia bisporula]|uniref:Golgi apparatus membrane protein TVP38 n=1 Tax=Trichodelitschia bisporula TaxID=703511 RepID=A0A6G1HX69_9PEZI|nr:hypothetical protein EJ06DRAFT_494372 [Trichodelitschia bisporula]